MQRVRKEGKVKREKVTIRKSKERKKCVKINFGVFNVRKEKKKVDLVGAERKIGRLDMTKIGRGKKVEPRESKK